MIGKIKRKINSYIKKHSKITLSVNYASQSELYKDKIVAVTGGSGDIGLEIALLMQREGAKVVIIGRNEEILQKKATENNMKYVVWDIENMDNIKYKINQVASKYGKVDTWVNCAGYISDNDLCGDFYNVSRRDWDKQFNINCKSLYFITLEVCKYMKNNSINGHIVQVLSEDGIRNTWQPYGISKRVGIEMTKGIAKRVISDNIIVNAVAPGGVATKMISKKMQFKDDLSKPSSPSKRLSTALEIANLVVFLGSDMANHMVGNIVELNGGSTL